MVVWLFMSSRSAGGCLGVRTGRSCTGRTVYLWIAQQFSCATSSLPSSSPRCLPWSAGHTLQSPREKYIPGPRVWWFRGIRLCTTLSYRGHAVSGQENNDAVKVMKVEDLDIDICGVCHRCEHSLQICTSRCVWKSQHGLSRVQPSLPFIRRTWLQSEIPF